ncbi:UNVERIFIED_CONTAM: hypothetical protein Sangu_2516700 [Sesamum angustifolium]|uniref:DRBM domain-containing protein n=1 Tax=Sesamum angustifolium TaxID=2727405 RepID=A0AAW2JJX2_9LAMI
MASAADIAGKKVGSTWVVGSTEDVLQALMQTLVYLFLPIKVSNVPPSLDAQTSVAKQMHAVVLLYNYHHRKQKPELKFLKFSYFCKLALILRPQLISFMNLMRESESMDMSGAEDHRLSVTEKAIKDACDIASALDASRDAPEIEGWPISKVAVLLLDYKQENCLLQFGAVTKGVWSLIEKERNDCSINPEMSADGTGGKKRKRNSQNASADTELLELAFDAVKEITGIYSSELEVLETHLTYSSSKEKSAACFYMMQCRRSFSINEQVPIKFLVESLHGPLAEKLAYGFWKTTPVVEYCHIIPYAEFISSWLSRKYVSLPSLKGCNTQSTMMNCNKELTQSRTSVFPVTNYSSNDLDHTDDKSSGSKVNSSYKTGCENCDSNNKTCKHSIGCKGAGPVNIIQSTVKDQDVTDKFSKRCNILDSAKTGPSRILEIFDNESKQHNKSSLSGTSRGLSQRMAEDDNAMEFFNKRCVVLDSAIKEACRINFELSDTDTDAQKKGLRSRPSRWLSGEAVIDDKITEKSNQKHDLADSEVKKESRTYPEFLATEGDDCNKSTISGSPRGPHTTIMSESKARLKNEDRSKKLNSEIRVYHHRRKNNSSTQKEVHVREDWRNLKVDMVDPLRLNDTQCGDQKVSGGKGDVTILCNQVAATGNQLVQFEAKIAQNVELKSSEVSEDLQNALALLCRRRQELHSGICNMEDTLAVYEDNIARIRDGGEVGLARQCIKSIIKGNHPLLLEHGSQVQDKGQRGGEDNLKSQCEKQTRLSGIYLPGKSACQDLEYICLKNNWRLPRYFIEPSDGKFLSHVIVEGKGFELPSKGGFKLKPDEARESAAAEMIAKIQNSCAQSSWIN